MKQSICRFIFLLAFLFLYGFIIGQSNTSTHISGKIALDSSWESTIYMSHIPTYDDLYVMSNEMIIAKTEVNSLGHFEFDLNFLPQGKNLYRLHVIKKGGSPATLIIGGKDENHLFLISNRFSTINLTSNSSYPPFKGVTYKNSQENKAFQEISQLVFVTDSIASESTSSKRMLLESQLQKDLLTIADTTNNSLVSLYALYKSGFESNHAANLDFYKSYTQKWTNQDHAYYKNFTKQLPILPPDKSSNTGIIVMGIILAFILTALGFFLGNNRLKKSNSLDNLSIQERKIYELLKQGVTNQEISDHFNIGLSTAKSHVSSIYSKLNVKSRKDIINRR